MWDCPNHTAEHYRNDIVMGDCSNHGADSVWVIELAVPLRLSYKIDSSQWHEMQP